MKNGIARGLGLTLAVVLQGAASAATPTVTTDLVMHNEIVIKASPAKLWPLVVELNSWKQGAKLVSMGGPAGQQGERFKAVMGDDQIVFYVENVEVEPQRRRTVRLNTVEGKLIGYAIWQLIPKGTETSFQYDVYSTVDLPVVRTDATPAQIEATKKVYYDANYQRFTDELAVLKKLAEGS